MVGQRQFNGQDSEATHGIEQYMKTKTTTTV